MFRLASNARSRCGQGVGVSGAGGGGGTRSDSAALAHGWALGAFRTTIQKRTAAATPRNPYRRNTPRQFCVLVSGLPKRVIAAKEVKNGATAPPIRPPKATTLLSLPRSS